MEKTTLLERIQKLYAKAESAKEIGSLAEAEAFNAKVNKLLIEHNLSMTDINNLSDENGKSDEEIIETERANDLIFGENKSNGTWDRLLLQVLAKHNMCDLLWMQRTQRVSVLGTKTNIEIMSYLYQVLKPKVEQIAQDEYSKLVIKTREDYKVNANSLHSAAAKMWESFPEVQGYTTDKDVMPSSYKEADKDKFQDYYLKDLKVVGVPPRGTWIRSFLMGVPVGLEVKLRSEREEMFTPNEEATTEEREQLQTTAVAVQSMVELHKENIKDFLNNRGGFTKSKSSREGVGSHDAFGAGRVAGEGLSTSQGIGGSGVVGTRRLN